ncbi:MAG: hypothetical protein HND51_13390 [Chloroflexi bacterium]|nr:hypothetical protein [Chloroflexota bacterium]
MESQIRRLLRTDWIWIFAAIFIASISSLMATSVILGFSYKNALGLTLLILIYSPVLLGASVSAGLASWWLIKRTGLGMKTIKGAIFGGIAAFSIHLLSSIFSGIAFFVVGTEPYSSIDEKLIEWIFSMLETLLIWVFYVTAFGIKGYAGFTLIWGALFGALLGWLYTRSRRVREIEKASLTS